MNKKLINETAHQLTQHLQLQGFEPEHLHHYTDLDGNDIYWRLRLKKANSNEKVVVPMSYVDGKFTLKEPVFTSKKPIYKQHLLKDDKLIFWVEGEVKADALCKLGIVATTAGGATSHTKADFEPLRGKEIRIWPDNDKPGFEHAAAVSAILKEINCSVATVDISEFDLPKGGDFIDWQINNPKADKDQILSLPLIQSDLSDEVTEPFTPSAPYPIDALPDLIRSAVEEVAGFTKAPVAMIASSALSAVSLAIQAQVDVGRDKNLTGPTSLFFLTIADSGERKSTVDKYFTKAIKQFEVEQIEKSKPEIQEFESDFSIWTQKRNGLLAKIKNPKPKDPPAAELEKQLKAIDKKKPVRPKVPQVLFQDATPEALSYDLHKVWPSGAVISAEAGIVFGSHGMGQDSVMRNLATLNILWDGGDLKVSRRTQESYSLIGARLTVSLQVQEPTVKNFIAKTGALARGTGFLARFLIAQPESTQGERLYTESPPAWPNLDALNLRISDILNSSLPYDGMGYLAPALVLLSKDAKELWISKHNEIESKLKGELYNVRDVASKTADIIARLACLFYVLSAKSGAISVEHVDAASRIAIWHLDQSRRFFSKLEQTSEESNADKLLDWLLPECNKNHGQPITKRHAQQFGPIRDGKTLKKAIEFLVEKNFIELTKESKGTLIKPKFMKSPQAN